MTDGELEILIESKEEAFVEEAEAALSAADVQRWEPARVVDPITVLAVVGGVVELVTGLLALRDRFRARADAPRVIVRNPDGAEIELVAATPEELRALLAATGAGDFERS